MHCRTLFLLANQKDVAGGGFFTNKQHPLPCRLDFLFKENDLCRGGISNGGRCFGSPTSLQKAFKTSAVPGLDCRAGELEQQG